MHHPWLAFRDLAHVTLRWAHLPEGLLGYTDHARDEVTLAHGLTQAERRCTIAHESEHVRRGPVPAWLQLREEQSIDQVVARRLIPFDRLVDALVWSRDDVEVAEELWVDVDTVRARLHGLTEAETVELNRRLDDAELRLP